MEEIDYLINLLNKKPTKKNLQKFRKNLRRPRRLSEIWVFVSQQTISTIIATVNEEEQKFDCMMMELQEDDALSVPPEYLNENELSQKMLFVRVVCW